MDNNMITNLSFASQSPSLKKLSLNTNLIEKIDGTIRFLDALEYLDVSRNNIVSISVSLYELPNLTTLFMESNEYQSISRNILTLRGKLNCLRFGWGAFCDPKQPIHLEGAELTYWFN